MVIGEISRLEFAGLSEDGTKVYTAIVNCVNLKRDIRIAYLVKNTASGLSFASLQLLTIWERQSQFKN
jgi:hypothetical protein